jgi:hypothetical protein
MVCVGFWPQVRNPAPKPRSRTQLVLAGADPGAGLRNSDEVDLARRSQAPNAARSANSSGANGAPNRMSSKNPF